MKIVIILAIMTIMLFSIPISYAHNSSGETIPAECKPLDEGNEFVHVMSVSKYPVQVGDPPIFPGDDVIAIANFNNPLNEQFQTEDIKQIRFLWFDGSNTLQQETIVPVDTDSQTIAQDIFNNIFGTNTTWKVIACYENDTNTRSANTIHMDVDSFLVLPESPFGSILLITASIGAVGMYLATRKKL